MSARLGLVISLLGGGCTAAVEPSPAELDDPAPELPTPEPYSLRGDLVLADASAAGEGRWQAAGDLDGDGVADLVRVVGQHPSADGPADALLVLHGPIPPDLDAEQADAVVWLDYSALDYSWVVSSLGDVDGDGNDDLALSFEAGHYSDDDEVSGLLVLRGPLQDGGSVGEMIDSSAVGYPLAARARVQAIGDRNGDGLSDVAVEIERPAFQSSEWAIFDGPLPRGLDPERSDLTIVGPAGYLNSIGVAADYDGDGRIELPVAQGRRLGASALQYDFGWLWLPKVDGVTEIDLSMWPDLRGPTTYDNLHSLPRRTGDLDGDGHLDLPVGVPRGGRGKGDVYVLGGPVSDASWPAHLSLQTARSRLRAWTQSCCWEPTTGANVDLADLNGDGRADLVFSAPGADESAGRVYVFYDVQEGETNVIEADTILRGDGNLYGLNSAPLQDVTGDGVDDLLVTSESRSWVFAGWRED